MKRIFIDLYENGRAVLQNISSSESEEGTQ